MCIMFSFSEQSCQQRFDSRHEFISTRAYNGNIKDISCTIILNALDFIDIEVQRLQNKARRHRNGKGSLGQYHFPP